MHVFALVGKSLGHSFSKAWFNSKFEREGLTDYRYINIELDDLKNFRSEISKWNAVGINITIPYKSEIIHFLDEISEDAEAIGAVNTVARLNDGTFKGFNTDHSAFTKTLVPLLKPYHTSALILGTGGASKAVQFSLNQLNIDFRTVSRHEGKADITYRTLTKKDIRNAPLIINTTPAGMFPNINSAPEIPYSGIEKFHLIYDLIYNPAETEFLKKGKLNGAAVCNGYPMLVSQAEQAWQIWLLHCFQI